jgi:hypothetical protein
VEVDGAGGAAVSEESGGRQRVRPNQYAGSLAIYALFTLSPTKFRRLSQHSLPGLCSTTPFRPFPV